MHQQRRNDGNNVKTNKSRFTHPLPRLSLPSPGDLGQDQGQGGCGRQKGGMEGRWKGRKEEVWRKEEGWREGEKCHLACALEQQAWLREEFGALSVWRWKV